jgi:predicted DNA-binding protein
MATERHERSVRFTTEQIDALVVEADRLERPLSWIVRKAVDEYLERHRHE